MESAGTPEGADAVLGNVAIEEPNAGSDGAARGAPPVVVAGRRFKRAGK
jgi:hypothetical protein